MAAATLTLLVLSLTSLAVLVGRRRPWVVFTAALALIRFQLFLSKANIFATSGYFTRQNDTAAPNGIKISDRVTSLQVTLPTVSVP